MRFLTDYESINLHTGERTRYVVGEGRRLTEREAEALKAFEKVMEEEVIPEIIRTRHARELAWQRIKHLPLDQ